MVQFTRKAIRDSFVKLLEQRPLSQITVRDIVEDCGVSRNTFYYYFQDLPDLVETVVREDAQQIMQEHPSIDSLEECIHAAVAFALHNRKAVLHIYHSVKRDIFELYQWRVCEHVVTVYMDGVLSGRKVTEEDRLLLIDYLKCVCFGVIIGWLQNGMKEEIQPRIHRICVLKQGDLEQLIARCEQNKE